MNIIGNIYHFFLSRPPSRAIIKIPLSYRYFVVAYKDIRRPHYKDTVTVQSLPQ